MFLNDRVEMKLTPKLRKQWQKQGGNQNEPKNPWDRRLKEALDELKEKYQKIINLCFQAEIESLPEKMKQMKIKNDEGDIENFYNLVTRHLQSIEKDGVDLKIDNIQEQRLAFLKNQNRIRRALKVVFKNAAIMLDKIKSRKLNDSLPVNLKSVKFILNEKKTTLEKIILFAPKAASTKCKEILREIDDGFDEGRFLEDKLSCLISDFQKLFNALMNALAMLDIHSDYSKLESRINRYGNRGVQFSKFSKIEPPKLSENIIHDSDEILESLKNKLVDAKDAFAGDIKAAFNGTHHKFAVPAWFDLKPLNGKRGAGALEEEKTGVKEKTIISKNEQLANEESNGINTLKHLKI
ncbi:MAG: hypothetical protein H2069_05720 [Legionella sp.]|nr:hypothetical protein [Legionella sp.]